MRKYAIAILLAHLASGLASGTASAQQPVDPQARPLPVAGGGNRNPPTTEVAPDHKVTLRIKAPTASDVSVAIGDSNFDQTYPMQKGADGYWSTTIGPLPPELYRYTFHVSGARVNGGFVDVPGTPPNPWEVQNVPHGSLIRTTINSTAQNRPRTIEIYLPADYFANPTRRYPVFYMWKPGGGADEYFPAGRPEVIMDNLIAQKKAVPMIVVMPGIEVPPSVALGSPEARDLLDKELVTETIPFVDSTYRTQKDRFSRAISGISQSGATSFTVGMRHLDLFGNVGEFGTGFFGGLLNPPGYTSYLPYTPDNVTPNLHAKLRDPKTKLKLFYMSVGTIDPRMPFQQKAAETFRQDGISVTFKTFAGGHEYTVWRNSFIDMASLLFK